MNVHYALGAARIAVSGGRRRIPSIAHSGKLNGGRASSAGLKNTRNARSDGPKRTSAAGQLMR